MKKRLSITVGLLAVLVGFTLAAGGDKYAAKVPGGLAFSEFKGYEAWQTISVSRNEKVVAVILGNPQMIDAYRAGFPANGKPAPDGAKMAKAHWTQKQSALFPSATVPGSLVNVDFMVKDGKRFADSGGWGYAQFDYDPTSATFTADKAGTPACGQGCHVAVKAKDYVFHPYQTR
jgi:cytochrome P460